MEAARAARRFPTMAELLIDGALTLTSITLWAPHLTEDNYREAELFFGPLIAREDRAAFGNERTVRRADAVHRSHYVLVGSEAPRAASSVVEHLTFNQGVPGSIPGRPTILRSPSASFG